MQHLQFPDMAGAPRSLIYKRNEAKKALGTEGSACCLLRVSHSSDSDSPGCHKPRLARTGSQLSPGCAPAGRVPPAAPASSPGAEESSTKPRAAQSWSPGRARTELQGSPTHSTDRSTLRSQRFPRAQSGARSSVPGACPLRATARLLPAGICQKIL